MRKGLSRHRAGQGCVFLVCGRARARNRRSGWQGLLELGSEGRTRTASGRAWPEFEGGIDLHGIHQAEHHDDRDPSEPLFERAHGIAIDLREVGDVLLGESELLATGEEHMPHMQAGFFRTLPHVRLAVIPAVTPWLRALVDAATLAPGRRRVPFGHAPYGSAASMI